MKVIKLIFFAGILMFFSCKKSIKNETKETAVDSRSRIVNASEINKAILEEKAIEYQNITIVGDIDFTLAKDSEQEVPETFRHFVNSALTLVNCTVKGKIIASKSTKSRTDFCTFTRNLTLLQCTLQDSLIFNEAEFQQLINIRSSEIEKPILFNGARFLFKKNYFSENKFYDNVFFNISVFEGEAIFFRSQFMKQALFQGSIFERNTQFDVCKFQNAADFGNIRANSGFFFNYAEFSKPTIFSNSRFSDRFEFQQCKIYTDLEFKNCSYFGSVKYNKTEVKGVLTFEKSIFHETAPDFTETSVSEGSSVIIKEAFILKKESLVITNLNKEKK